MSQTLDTGYFWAKSADGIWVMATWDCLPPGNLLPTIMPSMLQNHLPRSLPNYQKGT